MPYMPLALRVFEPRYLKLMGDLVGSESYLQHAEHYFRVLRAIQPNRPVSDIVGKDVYAANLKAFVGERPRGRRIGRLAKLIGIVPLFTGIFSTCPLYSVLGISTCAVKS